MIRGLALSVAMISLLGAGSSNTQTPETAGPSPVARELDAIRDQLVALNIESALAAANALLERNDLADADRVAALDLRAQAHAASDDLAGVEKDYRAILELKAGYAPERTVTSKKALARFTKIQAAMIGSIHLSLDPRDAALTVDGRPVALAENGTLAAVSGERRLRFTKPGFDPLDATAHVVAGQETLVKIQLIPNARALVVRTDVAGVTVTVDGAPAGVTARPAGHEADKDAPAALTIDNAAIGEHEVRLTKPCFATESVQAIVAADIADRSPKVLTVVAMRPAQTRVTAKGADYGADLIVDGERAATLPLTTFSMCPGARTIQVVASGRTVWSGEVEAEEADLTLDLSPRPNAVLVGSHWPAAWAGAKSVWSQGATVAAPQGADLTRKEEWSTVPLPPGTDLAVALIDGSGALGDERVVLYSPSLREVDERPSPPGSGRPAWLRATLGAVLADDRSGAVIAASVAPGGPAAKAGVIAGDRIVTVAGKPAVNAAAVRSAIETVGAQATLSMEIATPDGAPRKIDCVTSTEPRIATPSKDDASRVVRAAWASVDVAAGDPDAAAALAGLATYLEFAGRDAAALEAWQRVRQMGSAALEARATYGMGVGLQAAGKRDEAIEAFRQARSRASARGDVAIAAAAADRLADLGIAAR